ncbi:hypothetical protein BGZ67_005590 [Mortierella alpina]|nr:hypothetical protein BGZ67_005590 [Mortierella alpina]
MVGSMISAAPAPPESMVQFSTWDDPAPLKTMAWCDSPDFKCMWKEDGCYGRCQLRECIND